LHDNAPELVPFEYYFQTVAYFLTDVEAKKYIKYQRHNLANPRTYVDWVGYDNRGMLTGLMELLNILKFEDEGGSDEK